MCFYELFIFFNKFIISDTLGALWDPFYKIINVTLNRDIIYDLQKFKLFNEKEIEIFTAVEAALTPLLITKIVSDRIHNGDHNDFTNLVSWMETHWATKLVLQVWKKTCKIIIMITND